MSALGAIVPAWATVGSFVRDGAGLAGMVTATDIDSDGIVGVKVTFVDGSEEWYYIEDGVCGDRIDHLDRCPHEHDFFAGAYPMYRCHGCGDSVCDKCGIPDDDCAYDADGPYHKCYSCLSDGSVQL